ncbi:hypothetical protein [Xenorhabdus bovienii]|uniref:hypothetical protein n=1 Tax=Xenorhabdus bovienii TaxID=40576 RepID=UPI003DA4B94B
MKSIIFCLTFLLTSGCTLRISPIDKLAGFDAKDKRALLAVATLLNTYKRQSLGEKSRLERDKIKPGGDEFNQYDVINFVSGNDNSPSKKDASSKLYGMYYLIRIANPDDNCSVSVECVFSAMESGASSMSTWGKQEFQRSYEEANEKFKFAHYDPEKSMLATSEIANDLVKEKEARKRREIEENSKLPDTKPFEFTQTNDKYVNAALALINDAKLERHNIRDSKGNKTQEYGNPTIYGKPFFGDLYLYPRALLNQARSCEKASAYVRANIDNACKSAIVAGVKDWIGTARDPNISDVAWRAAANNAIIGDSIIFSHWAGMARVHQKSLNETGRISF